MATPSNGPVVRGIVFANGNERPGARVTLKHRSGEPLHLHADEKGRFEFSLPDNFSKRGGRLVLIASSDELTCTRRVRIAQQGECAEVRLDLGKVTWRRAAIGTLHSAVASPRRALVAGSIVLLVLAAAVDLGAFEDAFPGRFAFRNNLHVLRPELNKDRTTSAFDVTWGETARNRIRAGQTVTLRVSADTDSQWDVPVYVPSSASLLVLGEGLVRMSPKAALWCEGELTVKGTESAANRQPLVFTPGGENSWGAFVLWGPGANNSSISNARFDRGGSSSIRIFDPHRSLTDDQFTRPVFPPRCDHHSGTARRVGGALTIHNVENVSISDSVFADNEAHIGGAVAVFGSSQLKIERCEFYNNHAYGPDTKRSPGGAIFAVNSDGMVLRKCEFRDNRASDEFSCGGAIYLGFNTQIVIDQVQFVGNHAHYSGGAIYALSLFALSRQDRAFPNALGVGQGTINMTDVVFADNSVSPDSKCGGTAMRFDGGYETRGTKVSVWSSDRTRSPVAVSSFKREGLMLTDGTSPILIRRSPLTLEEFQGSDTCPVLVDAIGEEEFVRIKLAAIAAGDDNPPAE